MPFASASRRCRRRRSRRSRPSRGSTPTRCTGRRTATRSSSPRRWPPAAPAFPRPCATPCSRAPPGSARARGSCSTRSRSCRRTSSGRCSTGSSRTRTSRSTNARPPACCAPAPAGSSFRHELARLAIERRASAGRAADAAPRRARARSRDVDPARLAHHAEEAEDVEAILRFAPEAGERAAAVGAHREAAEQYARALRHADDVEPAVRAELARAARDLVLPDRPERRGARGASPRGADLSRARRHASPRDTR